MHFPSLEAKPMHHRPGVSSHRTVVDVADCRISVASQDIAPRKSLDILALYKSDYYYYYYYYYIGGGRISPNIDVATPNLVSLRRPSVLFVLPNLIDMLNGSPLQGDNFKNRTSDFKEKKTLFFKFVPSPTDHRGHIGKVLHGCTTAFLPLYKGIKIALKFYNILVIWCAQNDHFCPLFAPHLKV